MSKRVDKYGLRTTKELQSQAVCYHCLNNNFQYLNNITRSFTHFFTQTYFQKIQITLLEQHYQMGYLYIFHFDES